MANLTLNFKGLQALEKKLGALPEDLLEEIDGEIEKTCQTVVGKQKSAAPINDGALRAMNDYKQESLGSWVIFNNAAHSVYTEFGTGTKVKIPSELGAVASEAYQRAKLAPKSGVKFFDAILDWVKNKGIAARFSVKTRKKLKSTASDIKRERQAAFLIMRHIRKYGVKAQPFFFPAWFQERPKANKRIADAVRRVLRK